LTTRDLEIRGDDLRSPEVVALLEQHLALMRQVTPPESIHALDVARLREPGIQAWTVWRAGRLLGCGALKPLDPTHGEIKSMHTAAAFRGQGVGSAVLHHIFRVARERGYQRLSLETGSFPAFEPARSLYLRHGFAYCAPFGDYREDPNSVFMTRAVPDAPEPTAAPEAGPADWTPD
jgi:putative acetyltransferase